MEERAKYNTGATPKGIPWPEFADVLAFLGVDIDYGDAEKAMHQATVELDDLFIADLIAALRIRKEFKRCSVEEYEYYRNILERWME